MLLRDTTDVVSGNKLRFPKKKSAQTYVFLIRVASVAFFHNTVAKARARAARASQRGSSKRHNIVNPQLEGKPGPTYGIGDDAQRARTRQI